MKLPLSITSSLVRPNKVEIRLFQGHNSKPGPVYAGGGYTPMSKALRLGPRAIRPLLERFPDLVNEISTGGATPLHMCGKVFE